MNGKCERFVELLNRVYKERVEAIAPGFIKERIEGNLELLNSGQDKRNYALMVELPLMLKQAPGFLKSLHDLHNLSDQEKTERLDSFLEDVERTCNTALTYIQEIRENKEEFMIDMKRLIGYLVMFSLLNEKK